MSKIIKIYAYVNEDSLYEDLMDAFGEEWCCINDNGSYEVLEQGLV